MNTPHLRGHRFDLIIVDDPEPVLTDFDRFSIAIKNVGRAYKTSFLALWKVIKKYLYI